MATPPSSARKRGRPANNKASSASSPPPSSSSSVSSAFSNKRGPAAADAAADACQGTRKDGEPCNRKAKGDCAHGRCVACCERLAKPCAAHEALIKKRKEEEAILAGEDVGGAGGGADAMRIHPGDFRETSFEVIGDTIVLFSLRDFLRNKKWSKDALEQGLRRRRGRRGLGRDASGNGKMGKRELGLALNRRRAEKGRVVLERLYAAAVGGMEEV